MLLAAGSYINRRFAARVFVSFLCLIIIVVFFIGRGEGEKPGIAVITVNSVEAYRLDLSLEPDRVIGLSEDYGLPVSFEISGGAIRYLNVTCPDHTCEKTGFISSAGETAVCMPNRVVVTIL